MHHNTHPIYKNKNEFIKQVFSQILHALNMLHTNLGPIQVSKIFLYDSFDEWDFNAISVISQLYKLYNKYEGVRQYLFVKFSFHIYKIKLSIIVNSGDMI